MKKGATKRKQSATSYILKALIPYTDANLQLAFHPGQFFDELERISGLPRNTLRQSYTRAKRQKYITDEPAPLLTPKGRQFVQPFVATKLRHSGRLMVIFDIPEDMSAQRRQLRDLLKYLEFSQVQRSVWISSYDHRQVLREAIEELHVVGWVQLYEAERIG